MEEEGWEGGSEGGWEGGGQDEEGKWKKTKKKCVMQVNKENNRICEILQTYVT